MIEILFNLVFGAVFMFAAPAGMYFFFRDMKSGFKSRSWPSVPGQVVSSRLDYDSEVYRPRVDYEYTVEGRKHRGSRIVFMESRSNIEYFGRRMVERFAKGKVVDVYYDPDAPDNSVLVPGAAPARLFGTVVALVLLPLFFLLALGLFVSGLKGLIKALSA